MQKNRKNGQKAGAQKYAQKKNAKNVQKEKKLTKKVTFRGTDYFAEPKGDKVLVRTISTACGQKLLVGVFDKTTKSWHNDDGLPTYVKNEIERSFAKA